MTDWCLKAPSRYSLRPSAIHGSNPKLYDLVRGIDCGTCARVVAHRSVTGCPEPHAHGGDVHTDRSARQTSPLIMSTVAHKDSTAKHR